MSARDGRPPLGPVLSYDKSLTDKVARGSEARFVLDQQRVALGAQLVAHLSILVKTTRIHGRHNAALGLAAEPVLALLRALVADEPLALRTQADFLFMGESHLKMNAPQMTVFLELIDLMNAFGVGTIHFAPAVTAEEVIELCSALGALEPSRAGIDDLRERLRERGVRGITLEELREVTVKVGERNRAARPIVRHSYVKAASIVGETMRALQQGQLPSLKQARRAIHTIVDLMNDDESLVLALTTLRCYDQYTHNHSVNVAILAIALASRVGYVKNALAEVGLGALFHDLGKARVPPEVLNKPGELTPDEWRAMRTHPLEGVVCLARFRGVRQTAQRLAAASFEHHMTLDSASGYPKLPVPWPQSLTARIIAVTDFYDAITSARVYRRTPIVPERALKMMVQESGRLFDPVLVKLFVSCVGLLPIGSLVLLDTGELAVVTRAAGTAEAAQRPPVKLVSDAQGHPLAHPEDIELTDVDSQGRHRRSIAKLVDPLRYRLDTSRFLV